MHLNRVMLLTIDETTITLIPRFRVTREDPTTWTLHILQVEPDDTGYYVCQVNMEPAINQVGYVQVVVPPQFVDEESSVSHVSVQESHDVRLVCRARGVPNPNIRWTREDAHPFSAARGSQVVKHIDSEELVLKGVTRKDMGAYLCIATNKVPPSISKRIVLDVHFQPLITVPNQLVGAPVGTSVTLECQVAAFPNAVHFWRFNDQLLINSSRQETQELRNGYTTTMKLSLRNLRHKDFGTYVCAAKNSLGATESNVRLYASSGSVPSVALHIPSLATLG
ncbi:neurotrimin [Procambarus clarkii]|uniref:neurotrimin n=1 Tax=Procambarus clarkii TaxID=6728 RepID=UPI00374226AA